MTTSIPHLKIPFFLLGGNGGACYVEQNSLDEICQCVEVLIATELGSRIELPGYGTVDQTFTQQFDTSLITQAVTAWEPRAAVTITATPGRNPQVTVDVSVATVN